MDFYEIFALNQSFTNKLLYMHITTYKLYELIDPDIDVEKHGRSIRNISFKS